MLAAIARIPWSVVIVACLTLGLAPFRPEPHLVEKLRMLGQGELTAAVDWFDLVLHGTPWVLLVLRMVAAATDAGAPDAA